MKVTFCGHRDVEDYKKVKVWLYNKIEKLISEGATEFLLGGYGKFDNIAAKTVYELKQKYPEILSVFVAAYINSTYDVNLYDCSEFPSIENVPAKFAIVHRNKRMVDEADVVVAYVNNTFGGAAKTLEYAKRRKKSIINYYSEDTD